MNAWKNKKRWYKRNLNSLKLKMFQEYIKIMETKYVKFPSGAKKSEKRC